LLPLIAHPKATLYVNLEEARQLCHRNCTDSAAAAQALIDQGAQRVLVTDGGATATLASPAAMISAQPPEVLVSRVTGAGDTFMAAHIAAEISGKKPEQALNAALQAAAAYVSGDTQL
ncbi:MAG: bifunctional hydroxymethylpyrimidine kinase/phosphomethylpyrimidine kinase, partial [Marinosulfonomonas sp.]|nr:bifunctional hydroxymethylpyrimidine kinase/phosphomethylpyrimidine kinase [Marinosulfonomonas sp.]